MIEDKVGTGSLVRNRRDRMVTGILWSAEKTIFGKLAFFVPPLCDVCLVTFGCDATRYVVKMTKPFIIIYTLN